MSSHKTSLAAQCVANEPTQDFQWQKISRFSMAENLKIFNGRNAANTRFSNAEMPLMSSHKTSLAAQFVANEPTQDFQWQKCR